MNISTVMNNQISKSPVQQLQMHISEVTYDWCILLLTLDIKRQLVFPSPETGGESGVKRQFKWKLILNLLKTTPEQPNPSKAKGQKHHLIHHKVALRRYLCTLQAVWTTVARACPQMFFLHIRRLFRWSDSDMTYLSHIIVFTDDLINLRCVFNLVCLHVAAINLTFQYCFGSTKQFFSTSSLKQNQSKRNVSGSSHKACKKKMIDSECGSQWFS